MDMNKTAGFALVMNPASVYHKFVQAIKHKLMGCSRNLMHIRIIAGSCRAAAATTTTTTAGAATSSFSGFKGGPHLSQSHILCLFSVKYNL